MKKRVIKAASILGILAAVGIAYFYIYKLLGFGIPCVFYAVIGLKCPGCGVTRMCSALLMLDFKAAFEANRCLFTLMPVFLYYAIRSVYMYIKFGKINYNKAENAVLISIIIILILFAVYRNIVGI